MTTIDHGAVEARPGWAALLSGKNALYSLVLAGGVTLHAVNIYIVRNPDKLAHLGDASIH